MIDDLQLNNYIHLISKVSQQKVYDMMSASDVLLLPSIEEGIANVCIEAMFCKLTSNIYRLWRHAGINYA